MYANILVPVLLDEAHDSDSSFAAARALASEGARFTVLHVMETLPGYVAAEIPAEVKANTRREAEAELKQRAAALSGAGTALVSGHAGTTIVEYAQDNGIDCIVVASHKPGWENLFLGSTADRVVRHAKCSVHVIR